MSRANMLHHFPMLGFLPIEKLDKISCLLLLRVRAILAARGLLDILSHCFTRLKGGSTWRAVVLPESDRQGSGDKAVASNCYCTC